MDVPSTSARLGVRYKYVFSIDSESRSLSLDPPILRAEQQVLAGDYGIRHGLGRDGPSVGLGCGLQDEFGV